MVRRLRRGPVAYGSAIVPVILPAALWIGAWLLWPGPKGPGPSVAARVPRAVFVSGAQAKGALYTRPDLFGRPSMVGFVVPEREEKVPVIFPRVLPRRAALERRGFAEGIPALASTPGVAETARSEGGQYRVRTVSREAVFAVTGPVSARLTVSQSLELSRCGFKMPDPELEREATFQRGEMVFSVEIDENGRPAHVFPESGRAFEDAGWRVEKAIREGRAAGKGVPCVGLVTVSWESR